MNVPSSVIGSLPGQPMAESEACNQLIRDWATRRREIMMASGKDNSTKPRQQSLTPETSTRHLDLHQTPTRHLDLHQTPTRHLDLPRQPIVIHEPVIVNKVQAASRQSSVTLEPCFNKTAPVVRNIPIRMIQEPSGEFYIELKKQGSSFKTVALGLLPLCHISLIN